MFSALAKGNGAWNGLTEWPDVDPSEPTFDSLFPSIYKSSIEGDTKFPHTDACVLNQTQDHAIQLPKTYVTRKGAIVLFATQNGKNNDKERNRTDENAQDDSLAKDSPSFKTDNPSQNGPQTECLRQVQEKIPSGEKRKLFLEFLDVFLKDRTANKQLVSPTDNQNGCKSAQNNEADQTEDALKVLSRPKSINAFYNSSHHECTGKKGKTRPMTVPPNVLSQEPDQNLKAHPRITSAKPCPPVRALGKLPSKNMRSDFDKEKTTISVAYPPSPENHQTFETRHINSPNYSTRNETVQDDRLNVPRPNSECTFEWLSRAASSMSRYSAWWAMDDVSLSYYDNDDEYPECIKCLSERRSEVGRVSTSDTEVETEPEEESNASSVNFQAAFDEQDSPTTLQDFSQKERHSQVKSKNRVKSAPSLEKRRKLKSSTMIARKAHSAGPNKSRMAVLLNHRHDVFPSAGEDENRTVRIPSAGSYHGDHFGEDINFVSQQNSDKTNMTETPFESGVSEDNGDIILTNQGLSDVAATSCPVLSFVSHSGEGSGDQVVTTETIDSEVSNVDTFENSLKRYDEISMKTIKEDNASDVKGLREISRTTNPVDLQAGKTIDNEDNREQSLSKTEADTFNITERRDTEPGKEDGRKKFIEVGSVISSSEKNFKVNREKVEHQVIETESEEPNNDSLDEEVLGNEVNRVLELPTRFASEEQHEIIEDLPETSLHKDVLHEMSESCLASDVEMSEDLPETNVDTSALAPTTSLSDISKVPKLSETQLNTEVHEVQLFSDSVLNKDDLNETTQSTLSDSNEIQLLSESKAEGIIEEMKSKHYSTAQSMDDENALTSSPSRNISAPAKKNDSGSEDLKEIVEPLDIEPEKASTNRSSKAKAKLNDTSRSKTKVDEKTTTKEKAKSVDAKKEKTKRDKLDVKGVGKVENKTGEVKEKVEIKDQNKVDLSDLVAKKESKKPTKKPTLAKKGRSPKPSRKNYTTSENTPEAEPSLSMIPSVDENLLKMIENQDVDLELSEETLNQFAPVEEFQEPVMLSVSEDKPITQPVVDAFTPSKVKKGGKKSDGSRKKKGKEVESNVDEKDERRNKMAEEKAKQEEEIKLLKEREDEQKKLMEEAKEKQRTIEEERERRLAQETEARQQEEVAKQALKEAKRKAKEEREKKREEEAERRRQEVQRKREEKRKRELEIQKREEELARQRVDREHRVAELQAQKEREQELERIAEEQRKEEERLRLLQLEEERRQEEEGIREAEEAVQRMAREREYREQMRKIAEAQQAKLGKQELERRAREEEERAAIEDERKRLEHEAQLRENEERERVHELRQKEAIARIRAAHEASKRRAWALRRRAQNTERMTHLRFTRQAQKLTEAFTFSYHVHIAREVWELPYDWNSKKKRGQFRPGKKKK